MGTIVASSLFDEGARLIHDVDRVRWTDVDWLNWMNDGLRAVVTIKPDAYTLIVSHELVPSNTLQTIPIQGLHLLDVVRNMGADGLTPGRVVNVAARDMMDATYPDWHADPATGKINNFLYDIRAPKRFFVVPQAPATPWVVELMYAAVPPAITLGNQTLPLDDIYVNAVLNYMLYQAYNRDQVYGEVNAASDRHYQLFMASLGAQAQSETDNNPNATTASHSPATSATAGKPA